MATAFVVGQRVAVRIVSRANCWQGWGRSCARSPLAGASELPPLLLCSFRRSQRIQPRNRIEENRVHCEISLSQHSTYSHLFEAINKFLYYSSTLKHLSSCSYIKSILSSSHSVIIEIQNMFDAFPYIFDHYLYQKHIFQSIYL